MRGLVLLAAVALLLAGLLGGTAPFGRLALATGLPSLAAQFFADPRWRGVALFRAGDHDGATAAFAEARDVYNLGTAEAHAGNYAAALEAFDIGIAQGDAGAQASFDVVAAFYAALGIDPEALGLFPDRKDGAVAESFIARGDARAAGQGSEVTNANTMLGVTELKSSGEQLRVRRVFDDAFMIADERWLAQLDDVPGAFMAARIMEEHKRRMRLGLSPPEAEDPE